MAYWAAAQIQPQRDRVALHWLKLYGFQTYAPRLCDRRVVRGCKVIKTPLLFPGYVFVLVELQWSQAKFSPGVVRIVMDGVKPAVVPDSVITSLKRREVAAARSGGGAVADARQFAPRRTARRGRRALALRPARYKQFQVHPKMHPNPVFSDFYPLKSERQKCKKWLCCRGLWWWAHQGSNLGPAD